MSEPVRSLSWVAPDFDPADWPIAKTVQARDHAPSEPRVWPSPSGEWIWGH